MYNVRNKAKFIQDPLATAVTIRARFLLWVDACNLSGMTIPNTDIVVGFGLIKAMYVADYADI
jgi:hypothetical protein